MRRTKDGNAAAWFLLFAALAFLITWATGIAVVLSNHANFVNGARPLQHSIRLPLGLVFLLLTIGSYGPALAAIIVSALESGATGVRSLLKQFRNWQIGWRWFAIAALGPIAIRALALWIAALSGHELPGHWFTAPRMAALAGAAFGPWGEELGWRGYAQPRLQGRIGTLAASGIVGMTWFLWHYWVVATPAGAPLLVWKDFRVAGAPFLLLLVAESVVLAWLYNSTRASLPVAWAFHAAVNLGGRTIAGDAVTFNIQVALFVAAAIALTVVYGPRTLASRKVA